MKIKKKILSVLLSALFACSSIAGGYLTATAVPVQAAEVLETPQIIAAILALLGVSAIAKDSGSDSTSAVQAGYTAEYEMFMKYAYDCEMYSDKNDEEIDAMIAGWVDNWKHGTAVIGNDAWNLFQGFASSRYKDASISGGSSSDTTTSSVALCYAPGVVVGFYNIGETSGWYTLCMYRFNVEVKAMFFSIKKDSYLMVMPTSGTNFRSSGLTHGTSDSADAMKQWNKVKVPSSGDKQTGYMTVQYPAYSYGTSITTVPYTGTFKNVDEAYDYLGGLTEEDLKKDDGEDLPANFGIPWLSDGVKDLYDRDTSLGNYDVLGRTGTIDTDGTVTGDRVISLPDADTLDRVTTGEMSWADYMEKVGAIGIDKVDGITADTPVVKENTKDDSKTETIKDVYATAPSDSGDFLADLKELFPFCIPFDLIHALKILSADPETPYFEVPIKIHSFGINVDYTFVLDFEQFNMIAKVLRTMETLGFIVLLIWVTRDLIKG